MYVNTSASYSLSMNLGVVNVSSYVSMFACLFITDKLFKYRNDALSQLWLIPLPQCLVHLRTEKIMLKIF